MGIKHKIPVVFCAILVVIAGVAARNHHRRSSHLCGANGESSEENCRDFHLESNSVRGPEIRHQSWQQQQRQQSNQWSGQRNLRAAGKYLTRLDVRYSDDKQIQPSNAIPMARGSGPDINKGFGGRYVYLVPVWSESPGEKPVTGFNILIQESTNTQFEDLALGTKGDHRYLEPLQNSGNKVITEVALFRTDRNEDPNDFGWKYSTHNINAGRGGDKLYIVWKLEVVSQQASNNRGNENSRSSWQHQAQQNWQHQAQQPIFWQNQAQQPIFWQQSNQRAQPLRVGGGRYLTRLDVRYSDDKTIHPSNALPMARGSGPDINKGFGGNFVYLVPVWSEQPQQTPVTGFNILIQSSNNNEFDDLALGTKGDHRYLEPVQEVGNKVITEIALFRTDRNEEPSDFGWRYSTNNINLGRGGDKLYIVWKMENKN